MMQIKIEINGVLIHFVNVMNTGEKFIDDDLDEFTIYNVSLSGEEKVQMSHDPDDGALRLAHIALGKLT